MPQHTRHHSPHPRSRRREHSQNFLVDDRVVASVVRSVARTTGPILEIGPGGGALTRPLTRLGRPLTAVEIDPRLARSLEQRLGNRVDVVRQDFLRFPMPSTPHVVVSNVPFHVTTPVLRTLLDAPAWSHAFLLVQWDVARRRAGAGGRSLLTAQWEPWFTVTLGERVPAAAFRPRPSVDGGLLTITRRDRPLVDPARRTAYQDLVRRVFTGPGRGLAEVLARAGVLPSVRKARDWLPAHGLSAGSLPRDLPPAAWVDLFCTSGVSPPRTGRR